MENRITRLLQEKLQDVLSIYFTAGYPGLNDTILVIEALENAGVDMVEIGIPFSDPLADGPTIQHSSEVALKNGMSLNLLFEQLEDIRQSVQMPLLLMGYLNPVLQFGMDKFCEKCSQAGIDGVILPDLPIDEYLNDYKKMFEANNLSNVFLITPQTSAERIRLIDTNSKGFIYMVATDSTTGKKTAIHKEQEDYFKRIKKMKLRNPAMIGFGIHNRETFLKATNHANGAIIGSAFIKTFQNNSSLQENIRKFVKGIKN